MLVADEVVEGPEVVVVAVAVTVAVGPLLAGGTGSARQREVRAEDIPERVPLFPARGLLAAEKPTPSSSLSI